MHTRRSTTALRSCPHYVAGNEMINTSGRRSPSVDIELAVITEARDNDESVMSSESTSRGESASPSYGFASVRVGICAMNKKTLAQPMKNILSRLAQEPVIELVFFSDDTILNEPVEQWPICHSLIAFYSHGFPLEKAIEYVKLRKPMVLNDLESQYALMDRRMVYEILMKNGVEVPHHMVVNREGDGTDPQVVETDDVLEINGTVFHKPFVEKPIDAENHNIYIYFPSDYGGGAQRLFRKVKDRSSTYSKVSSIRTEGSFIYEEFMPTDGTDVKVYSVGPDYAHAEARKSPALDGKVERDENGKEIRYPVLLTAQEKLIARKVCMAFKQIVCGFDLLRANGKSYVCDVNGFSFVKNSQKYYNDCAQILVETIIGHIAPYYFPLMPPSVEYLAEEVPDLPVPIPVTNNVFELRCVIGVIRHGDRTPKQKMKMIVKHRRFFDLFETFNGYEKGELKLKKPKELQMVLDISRDLVDEIEQGSDDEHEVEEKVHKLKQLKTVLEMYGTFSGINRKVQFKLINKRQGETCPVLLLILKWGGELTPAGKKQAEEYGRTFRCTYPGGEGEYSSLPGSGFLRLHSTYRHDLKVYASDEGRVQMTAAAFTKGLLDLEGSLASVLVHLVKRDQAATNMLDTFTDAQDAMNNIKEKLHEMMRSKENFNEDSYAELAPSEAESIVEAMHRVKNPHKMCVKLHEMISQLLSEIREIANTKPNTQLYQGETLDLMIKRWVKLEKDFRHKRDGHFDISKIPDIYDCIKYDLQHNSDLHLKTAKDLFNCVMPMADIVIPQEYGISVQDKLDIAKKICSPLLRKIQADLHHTIINEQGDFSHRLDPHRSKGVVSPNRHVRTRLYFTSESHVHSLFNLLQYGGLVKNPEDDPRWKEAMDVMKKAPELNYMTQFVFMLFEDVTKPEGSTDKYHVDIHFSPGIKGRRELIFEGSSTLLKKSSPELPEKSPQVFVKRLSHGSMVSASEGVAIKIGTDSTGSASQKKLSASSSLLKKSSTDMTDLPGLCFVPRILHGRLPIGSMEGTAIMTSVRRTSDATSAVSTGSMAKATTSRRVSDTISAVSAGSLAKMTTSRRVSDTASAVSMAKTTTAKRASDTTSAVSTSSLAKATAVKRVSDITPGATNASSVSGGGGKLWDDLPSRYVMSSRSTGGGRLLRVDAHGRKASAPNVLESLRSASDTKLVERDRIAQINEEKQGQPRRKKSASDSLLEPQLQELEFRIGDTTSRSKSDGDVTGDDSPKLLESSNKSLSSSSPDVSRKEKHSPPDSSMSCALKETDKPTRKVSAPSVISENKIKHIKSAATVLSTTSSHTVAKQKFPRKKEHHATAVVTYTSEDYHHPQSTLSSKTTKKLVASSKQTRLTTELAQNHSRSLTTITSNEDKDKEKDMKKWGSIEQLRDFTTGEEVGWDSQQSMVVRGLEMASELATQIEPLIHVASMSLMDVNAYLATLTGIELDYDIRHKTVSTEQKRPSSAIVHHLSISEEPTQLKTMPNQAPIARQRHQVCLDTPAGDVLSTLSMSLPHHDLRHRNSVGSIDTETFGRIKINTISPGLPSQHLPLQSLVDTSYISPVSPGTLVSNSVQPSAWSGCSAVQSNSSSYCGQPNDGFIIPRTFSDSTSTNRNSSSPLS